MIRVSNLRFIISMEVACSWGECFSVEGSFGLFPEYDTLDKYNIQYLKI